jgi:hypothetical protein
MPSIKDRVQRLGTEAKQHSQDDVFCENAVRLMKYFGWTLEELKALPIPSYFQLVEIVTKIEKPPKHGGGDGGRNKCLRTSKAR